MLQLMQPLLAALIGAAMSLFGLLHTVQLFPTPVIWHQFVVSMPPLMAVLLFTACVALALGGMKHYGLETIYWITIEVDKFRQRNPSIKCPPEPLLIDILQKYDRQVDREERERRKSKRSSKWLTKKA
ncbi:MAG: hypothetical protein GC164_02805 [Phycisphaera sp.]|nr:hypothetical protein [Phycisphaera sp.]